MQCPSCGRDRPRSGRCPHCGAPAPVSQNSGSYSSLRGWKDQQQGGDPGTSLPPRDRPSRPSANDSRSSSYPRSNTPSVPRSNTPSRPRRDGADWGAPGQSYARRGDPGQSYSSRRGGPVDPYEMDDERSLMVAPPGGALAFPGDDRALPALPSEEEERAMGIRRPAFIPATEERKGKRAGRWRVLSGVASIMLLCVGMCAVTGVLAGKNVLPGVQKFLGISGPKQLTAQPVIIPPAYQTPGTLVTPAPLPTGTTTPISGLQTSLSASNVNGQLKISGQRALFLVGDTVNVSFKVQGAKANDAISIKWYISGVDITPSLVQSNTSCCSKTMVDDKATDVIFGLQVPSPGFGRAEIYYNKTLAYTAVFDVVTQSQQNALTPTPAKSTTTPTAPAKH